MLGKQQGLLATCGDTYPLTINTEYMTQSLVTLSHSGQGSVSDVTVQPLVPQWPLDPTSARSKFICRAGEMILSKRYHMESERKVKSSQFNYVQDGKSRA